MGPDEHGDGEFGEYLDHAPDLEPLAPHPVDRPRPVRARRGRALLVTTLVAVTAVVAAGAVVVATGGDEPRHRRGDRAPDPSVETTATTVAGVAARCIAGVRPVADATSSVTLTIGNCAPGITEIRFEPVAPASGIVSVGDLVTVADPGQAPGVVAACQVVTASARCGPVPAAGIPSVALVTVSFAGPTRGTGAQVRVVYVARTGAPAEAVVNLP